MNEAMESIGHKFPPLAPTEKQSNFNNISNKKLGSYPANQKLWHDSPLRV